MGGRRQKKVSPMTSELGRLASYRNVPDSNPFLASRMASSGFYYTPTSHHPDMVTCFSCKCQISDWNEQDEPDTKHREINPKCAYVNGKDSHNVPFGAPEPADVKNINSSANLSSQVEHGTYRNSEMVDSESQSDHGTHNLHLQSPSHYPCRDIDMDGEGFSMAYQSGQLGQHKLEGGAPPSMYDSLGRSAGVNQGIRDRSTTLPLPITKSSLMSMKAEERIFQMKRESMRLVTFDEWPQDALVNKEDVAKAGLYHVGPGDRVRCAFCFNVLKYWEKNDVPMVEHKRYFPRCIFFTSPTMSGNIPIEAEPSQPVNSTTWSHQQPGVNGESKNFRRINSRENGSNRMLTTNTVNMS